MDNESVIASLFTSNFTEKEKRRAMADAEAAGTLDILVKKYYPKYYYDGIGVLKMKLLKDLGWL